MSKCDILLDDYDMLANELKEENRNKAEPDLKL